LARHQIAELVTFEIIALCADDSATNVHNSLGMNCSALRRIIRHALIAQWSTAAALLARALPSKIAVTPATLS